ncbi:uncharacterized protein BO97DRAFT_469223 [Aspergillus homomorphus CBS 101889]|uniref:Zn(2)-C6 fungal-type domain-containing protein n=1 Tax=Aspergillus homomorphus (strain CBS 101889) TaxID=1450537 RepID=A0A395I383_ASPHC|nr:hypothetical protein BO97DRAFT_469223 [Aspergillus homomorphus CBS 101889]RAL14417.1 hypothetical protein BO97DRAFT_469223 [Aspergillus homomorphus CBS 101889]
MDKPPPSKRPRLSMACNVCRQRKVKCDAEYPKCRNCRIRNQVCVTTDPQRPGVTGLREWLDLPAMSSNEVHPQAEATPLSHRSDGPLPTSQLTAAATAAALDEVSPVHHPFDGVSVEDGCERKKVLGGSSSQCLAKSLDVYFTAARLKPVTGFFRHGLRFAEELELPLCLSLPELPDSEVRQRYLTAFLSRIHPLYPIFHVERLKAGVEQLAALAELRHLSHENIPRLVTVYLGQTEDGDRYLLAAAGLLSHVITIPYLPAVQALLLFTIVYRGRNKEGLAWQTLGMAIRVAYTLGLHRLSGAAARRQYIHRRVWLICWSLEKMMHLESGRPMAISIEPCQPAEEDFRPEDRFLRWHVQLADYQGNISHHIYNHHPRTTRTARQILLDTARLDQELLSWANQIPSDLRPGNDIFCPKEEFHHVTFLAIQYHEAMISLHRAALIAPTATFDDEVTRYCANEPSQHRLRNGESICVNSARAIAKLSIELSEREADSQIITAGPSILACIVLGIFLMKHPGSKLRAMDLQLLKACLGYTSVQMSKHDADPRFVEGLHIMYEQISAYLQSHSKPSQQSATAQKPPPYSSLTPTLHAQAAKPVTSLPTPSAFDDITPTTWHQIEDDLRRERFASARSEVPLAGAGQFSPGLMGGVSLVDGFEDQYYPFAGYNVDELWNWMLYGESPETSV